MWISSRRSQAVLLALLVMRGLGFGITFWCATGPPLAVVSRDPVLQTQWRRVMVLRMPAGGTPGGRIDKQSFSPIAIPLAGVKLITWRPQESGSEIELTLPWQMLPAFSSWLARCGIDPRSFSLEHETQVFRLRLQLEAGGGTQTLGSTATAAVAADGRARSFSAGRGSLLHGAVIAMTLWRRGRGRRRLDGVSAGRGQQMAAGVHG